MQKAAGIIVFAGGVTLLNDLIVYGGAQGLQQPAQYLQWKVIPATAVAALIFEGLGELNPKIATALAGLVAFSVLFLPHAGGKAPVNNILGAEQAIQTPGVVLMATAAPPPTSVPTP